MKKRSPKYLAGRGLVQSRIPPDQANQALSQNLSQSLLNKAPYVDACVVSTYEARPINASDFEVAMYFNADQIPAIFTVPQGKIAVVKSFDFEVQPIELSMNEYGFYSGVDLYGNAFTPPLFSISFTIDNIGVENYTNFFVGLKVERNPVYFTAGPGQVIRMVMNNTLGNPNGYVSFYGQLLQDSGRAVNYEPGTLYPLPTRQVIIP